MQRALVETRGAALVLVCTLGIGTLAFWILLIRRMLRTGPQRSAIAAEIERKQPRLQDRLNTLLFLENRNSGPRSPFVFSQIADQAGTVLDRQGPERVYASRTPWLWFAVFVSTAIVVFWFGWHYAPWEHLRSSSGIAEASVPPVAPKMTTALTNAPTKHASWAEVRITNPGTDLKVTRVDVVPLSIESAADQELQKVYWVSSVNGMPPNQHDLPPPADPHYAVYEPTLYLHDLELSDWDVVTYYAKAETSDRRSYASEVYFLEVQPFREDLLNLPGGSSGNPHQALSELSSLVGRQQRVIRDTHAWAQREPERKPEASLKTLSHAETELADAAQHVYADMSANMENQPVDTALQSLAKAQTSLGQASASLEQDLIDQAQNQERAALAQLVAARKEFQKTVNEHSQDFNSSQSADSRPALDDSKRLNEMAEFRDEAKSAEEFVRNAVDAQRQVERDVTGQEHEAADLASKEQEMAKRLQGFAGEHPRAFQGSESQTDQAERSLEAAQEKLSHGSADASGGARQATESLEQLQAALRTHEINRQLADAYRLKRMLDEQARKLGQLAQSCEKGAAEQISEMAASAQATLDRLRKNLPDPASNFGQQMRDALSPTNSSALDHALSNLQQTQSDAERRRNTEIAQTELDKLNGAFTTARPSALQEAHKNDPLKEEPGACFAQGLKQLESLLRQLEGDRQISPEAQAKQSGQALANLQSGMRDEPGNDSRGQQLLEQLQQLLSSKQGLDPARLRQLSDQLEQFSAEISNANKSAPELANFDPARLPPAYRGRIEKYFQKLSEQ
jgi:hypothetical protein